eukprot:scaffold5908_cov152-Skeletonema_marinoi.AAC.11
MRAVLKILQSLQTVFEESVARRTARVPNVWEGIVNRMAQVTSNALEEGAAKEMRVVISGSNQDQGACLITNDNRHTMVMYEGRMKKSRKLTVPCQIARGNANVYSKAESASQAQESKYSSRVLASNGARCWRNSSIQTNHVPKLCGVKHIMLAACWIIRARYPDCMIIIAL